MTSWNEPQMIWLLNSGFEDLEVESIEAYVDPINLASMRVLEKFDFLQEGLLRKSIIQKEQIRNAGSIHTLRPDSLHKPSYILIN